MLNERDKLLNFWGNALLAAMQRQSIECAINDADVAMRAMEERCRDEPPRRVEVASGSVKVGGRAQVLRYEPPAEGQEPNRLDEGWTGPWTSQHEESVTAFRGVIAICLPGNGVVLENGLSYPPSCLVEV